MLDNLIWGYVYPNESEIQWSILIVLYPYITGLVAGAFIASSLYHVFGKNEIKPVARFALLTALSFLLVAMLPLLVHLGRPERGIEIMFTPHLTSAMSGFGYIFSFYLIIVVLEIWLSFREDIVKKALSSHGWKELLYSSLALFSFDISEKALHDDEKFARKLAIIGIPSAAFLHGYVGFIFGGIKANPWWSTPLMPIIFLMSAIVSGIALLILLYIAAMKIRKHAIDHKCLQSLAHYLWIFLILDVTLELLEIISMKYASREDIDIINRLLSDKIGFTFWGVQLTLGILIPFILLLMVNFIKKRDTLKMIMISISCIFVVIGVFAMRWNVVIGGQEISKSLVGTLTYVPVFFSQEGVLPAIIIFMLPFIILRVVTAILPPWKDMEEETQKLK
ncbi:MAG: polysulfide reductase NrfD [Candidatus Methanoperedens sp.]|nr:NrfD/PsrC family molybdoenzyme membrane anchor subunit [Candidatus Methanoperedens sp. BLZ2]KAB2947954.1 MAG: polysulfide reductase [Candidatus Methanoperedens sp.]MBZ0174071.1 polysulfide reductase NrfD [Candidatus Methanoperedens nitroreducens]MCX9079067.1 polysulfide reductase NrfD [Candidatus Methanoperedens sp.]MCX9087816.1 polysulfide reductase NrfD [Candidatus Methanoperedens sp.]